VERVLYSWVDSTAGYALAHGKSPVFLAILCSLALVAALVGGELPNRLRLTHTRLQVAVSSGHRSHDHGHEEPSAEEPGILRRPG
jgi:hypothetical protein